MKYEGKKNSVYTFIYAHSVCLRIQSLYLYLNGGSRIVTVTAPSIHNTLATMITCHGVNSLLKACNKLTAIYINH
ncbi:hypothetical protein HanIR_Chr01g0050031 [Helianthus annuus]|nr:hypothetical protein HanIR_Chr01g0050031 [Helianthus annuus]